MRRSAKSAQKWWILGLFLSVIHLLGSPRTEAFGKAPDETILTGVVVDESGKPAVDVEVGAEGLIASNSTKTDASGVFRVKVARDLQGRPIALVSARDGAGRLGTLRLGFGDPPGIPVRVVLKPARRLEVQVVDGQTRPVQDAEVRFLVDGLPFVGGRTDALGRWTANVPTDVAPWGVYALKSKVGLDYQQAERARNSAEPLIPLPERMTLTLDGARPPLRVRIVAPDGKPIPGVMLMPTNFQKPGRESTLLASMADVLRPTDADGYAIFDWLPERLVDHYYVLDRSPDYYRQNGVTRVLADKPVDQVTITLYPYVRLSGRVLTPDGRGASNAKVNIEGHGAGIETFRGQVEADGDGRYEIKVYGEYAYILKASKDGMAAPLRPDVIVRAGKPAEGIDLVLGRGTRVKGRVTVGEEQPPTESTYIRAIIKKGDVPADILPPGVRARTLSMSFDAPVDVDGRYEFLLGPGEYRVEGPARVEPVQIVIPAENPPLEIVQNFAMPRPEFGQLKLTVVDGDGKPVVGALVEGGYHAARGQVTPLRTKEGGVARIRRWLDPLVLGAATPDRTQGGVVRLNPTATEARIVLKPTATASGRLVDPEGKFVVDRELTYAVRVVRGFDRHGSAGEYFGGVTRTDHEGRFQLTGLVVGELYGIHAEDRGNRRSYTVRTEVIADRPGLLDLGQVSVDMSPSKPYSPLTEEQITTASFTQSKDKTPSEKLKAVLEGAELEYTRPLLLFGRAEDPACLELFRLFNERSEQDDMTSDNPSQRQAFYRLRWEFELASLDDSQADVQAFASDLGVAAREGKPPVLVVLSGEGKPVASHSLTLEPDRKLDVSALGTFLLAHKLPTRDAEAMLSAGLRRAKAEDKRLFVEIGGSWCGPCRSLGRFLEANKAELERHYVLIRLDASRDVHAMAVAIQCWGTDRFGVPTFAILDAEGKTLITSNVHDLDEYVEARNIGFPSPSSKSGINHFMTMFKQTAPRMSDETLAGLRQQLEKKP
ncbi:thioredoxin family protein [Paludisphaera rhizosphaerae]|uniref:thioredoxin family protein n=1 Tax=Paludisphaera rhizosphaerae TaxID=2711216 RepID=UPI0013ED2EC3|nr:thioredoxin family protein [Paludisphaera rhizosphaerae]